MSLILLAAVLMPFAAFVGFCMLVAAEAMFGEAPAPEEATSAAKEVVEPSRVPSPVSRSGDFRISREFAKSL